MHCEFSEPQERLTFPKPRRAEEDVSIPFHSLSRPQGKETTAAAAATPQEAAKPEASPTLDLTVKKCCPGMSAREFLSWVVEKTDFRTYLSRVLSFLDSDIRDFMLLPQFERIWQRVFTHASVIEDPRGNYELPETIGDAFVNANFKILLVERYPSITDSEMTSLSNHYMSKAFQPKMAKALGMENHLIVSESHREFVKGDMSKILEDVFESFCGALAIISRIGQMKVKEHPGDMEAIKIALKIGIFPPVKSLLAMCFSYIEPIDFRHADQPAKNQIDLIIRKAARSLGVDRPKKNCVVSSGRSVFLDGEAVETLKKAGFQGITRVDEPIGETASCIKILDSIASSPQMQSFLRKRPEKEMTELGFTEIREAAVTDENPFSIITASFKGKYYQLVNRPISPDETKELRMMEALSKAREIWASQRS